MSLNYRDNENEEISKEKFRMKIAEKSTASEKIEVAVNPDDESQKEYIPHPLASLFPPMDEQSFERLVEDIKANGQLERITLSKDGRILDGLNRYRACQELGIPPSFDHYDGEDETAFVFSKNVARRHLTTSQRAMIAAQLAEMKVGDNQHSKEGGQFWPPSTPMNSNKSSAQTMKVSTGLLKAAKFVLANGDQDLIKDVVSGKIAVSKAEKELKSKVRADNINFAECHEESQAQNVNEATISEDTAILAKPCHSPSSTVPMSDWMLEMFRLWEQGSPDDQTQFRERINI